MRKEIRLLLPAWLIALVISLAPAVVSRWVETPKFMLLMAGGGVMALVMALGPFGREFSQGTFSTLLAQPVSRTRVWWTKVLVLGGALLTVYAVWWFSFSFSSARSPDLQRAAAEADLTPLSTFIFVLVALAGGLWTTLIFRQVAAAIWFAVLLPTVLATIVAALVEKLAPGKSPAPMIALVVLLYAAGGFLLAWRMFLRIEDVQWTGGIISLRGWRRLPSTEEAETGQAFTSPRNQPRRSGATRALLRKELHLHQPLLMVAILLLVLHVGVLVLRQFSSIARMPMMEMILGSFWGLWLTMPFLINATATAEERKLGVHETQLCQAVGWRQQLFLKFIVSTLLGLALGVLPPCLLESRSQLPNFFSYTDHPWYFLGHWAMLGFISASLGLAGTYASTLARNTLQALGLGILAVIAGGFFLSGLARPDLLLGRAYWVGDLGLFIGYPLFGVAVLVLLARNYQRLSISFRDGVRNVVTLAGVACASVLLTAGIYHRVWEQFQETDPVHRAARIGPGQLVRMQSDGMLTALGPDGTLQVFPRIYQHRAPRPLVATETWTRHSHGSNWLASASGYYETVAIRTDGTLWASESPRPTMVRSTEAAPPTSPLIRYGTDTGWMDVVRDPTDSRSVLLLKSDGTLWRWNAADTGPRVRESILLSTPQRLGSDSDWVRLLSAGQRVYVTKRDGRVWAINHQLRDALRNRTSIDAAITSARCEYMDRIEWRALFGPPTYDLGVKSDGTLWAVGSRPWARTDTFEQLDQATDWQSVAGNFNCALALKTDGSLWKIDFTDWNRRPRIFRLGRQTDWRAVAGAHDTLFALAADGDIWRWSTYNYRPGWVEIAPSRIPLRTANILD